MAGDKTRIAAGLLGRCTPNEHAELIRAAKDAGFDAVFTAEAWGSDAYTPLAWLGCTDTAHPVGHLGCATLGAHTHRVRDVGADPGSPLRRAPHPDVDTTDDAAQRFPKDPDWAVPDAERVVKAMLENVTP